MNMSAAPPVSSALTALSVPHRVFTHAGAVESLAQAAAERNQSPAQIVRTILFRLGEGEYAMVLMAGPAQISWRALRQHVGRSRLTTASRDEVLQVTGYPIGAVAPFGLPQPLRVLIDESVLQQAEVSLGSGVRGVAIILRSQDLAAALPDAEIGEFRQEAG